MIRRQRFVYTRVPTQYVVEAKGTDAEQPDKHDRGKQEPDPMSAIMLQSKEADQYETSNRNHRICIYKRKGIITRVDRKILIEGF